MGFLTLSDSHDLHHLENSKTVCLACNLDNVTIVKIDKRLPSEIGSFFTPFPSLIEQLFAVSQFQYCSMAERITHQEQLMEKMTLKLTKQKNLLLLAKEKVSQMDEMEKRIKYLEDENRLLKSNPSSRPLKPSTNRPTTIDLTEMDSFGEEMSPRRDNRKIVTNSFLDQVKQSSTNKSVPVNPYTTPSSLDRGQHNSMNDFSRSRIAESTNINNISPSRQPASLGNAPIGTRLQPQLQPQLQYKLQTPTSRSSLNSLSNASSNSFNSRSPERFLAPISKQRGHLQQAPDNNSNNNLRITKNRAATAQLAQRLSAHMKVGSLQRAQSSNSNSHRPGSSFSNNNTFGRR